MARIGHRGVLRPGSRQPVPRAVDGRRSSRAAVFAVRVGPDAEPILSHEHDDARWLPLDAAHREVVWPGYRTAIERIRDDLSDPARAAWFELDLEGQRKPR